MAFNVKNEECDRLLRELTDLTGESLTEAISQALRERIERERRRQDAGASASVAAAIARLQALPVLDDRDPDEILGFDERGLPA